MPNLFTQLITPIVPLTACLQAGGSPGRLDQADAMMADLRKAMEEQSDPAARQTHADAVAWLQERIDSSRAQMARYA